MCRMQLDLRETHMIGKRTREKLISPQQVSEMSRRGMELAGISEPRRGFFFVRHAPAFALVIGTLRGAGKVWVDGKWRGCGPGQVCLLPIGAPHAYKTVDRWEICWAHLAPGSAAVRAMGQRLTSPTLLSADVLPLGAALEGLHRGVVTGADLVLLHLWLELADTLLQRICQPGGADPRLARLWEIVAADLSHPWNGRKLSARMGLSTEHLRRLCLKYYGMPPMARITRMRMDRAAALLGRSLLTVSAIAEAVGYSSPFAFSTAFKRQMGISPSAYIRPA